MKKDKFTIITVCMIIFFVMSFYLSFRYSIVLPKDEHIESIKEIFDLDENTQIIALTREISWLTPTLRALYKENNKIEITEEKGFKDGDIGAQIANYVNEKDIFSILAYINVLNIIIWIYLFTKRKN